MVKRRLLKMHAPIDLKLSMLRSLTVCILAKSALCVTPEERTMFCQFDNRHVIHPPRVSTYFNAMPGDGCTDIFIGFYDLDIRKGPPWQFTFEHIERDLVQTINLMRLRLPSTRVHLSVGIPEGPIFTDMIPNLTFLPLRPFQSDLDNYAGQTLSFMKANHYAGLNIYWTSTYSYTETRKLVELMATLRRRVDRMWEGPKLNLSVTFNAFPLKGVIPSNLYKIHRYIDFFIVKAFDKSVDSTPITSHTHPWSQSPQQEQDPVLRYFSQEKSVKWYVEHGIPAEKIIIAFPTYVRALIYAPPEPSGAAYPNTSYYFTIIQPRSAICKLKGMYMWEEKWNEYWKTSYLTLKSSPAFPREYMFYHNADSISYLCNNVIDPEGYRGFMAWTIFMDNHLDDALFDCPHATFETIYAGSWCTVKSWDYTE